MAAEDSRADLDVREDNMAKKIYIGNLSFSTTEETLTSLFSRFGEVDSANIIKDKVTGQSKGFGFVEMSDEKSADSAIAFLHQKEVDGRRIRVSVAEEKPHFNRNSTRN